MDVPSFEDMLRIQLQNDFNNLMRNNENNENNEVPIRRLTRFTTPQPDAVGLFMSAFNGTNDWFNFDEEIEEFIDIDDDDDDLDGESASGVSNNNNNNNSHECPICLETREKYYTLIPCGHVLCASCIHRIKKTHGKNTCFICRRKAKKKLRIYL